MAGGGFTKKLNFLIKTYSCLRFPQNFSDYLPVTEESVRVESSYIARLKNRLKAKSILGRLQVKELKKTYQSLSDEYSREMFLRLILIKLFPGASQIFPRYWSDYLTKTDKYKQLIIDSDCLSIVSAGHDVSYSLFDLRNIGFPIKMYYSLHDTIIDFVLEQYRYKDIVKVADGDVVINGGACYGNTALYLAHLAGERGKVYAFEFMEENLELYQKNMDMNPEIKDRIQLVQRPLGADSSEVLYGYKNGPATTLYQEKNERCDREYRAISIDDFVEDNNIQKIDFIKLDIEGSELRTLHGAKNTIRRFRPKLAICIYHKKEDLWELPAFIKELIPEYNLYVDHFTVKDQESVLFAVTSDKLD